MLLVFKNDFGFVARAPNGQGFFAMTGNVIEASSRCGQAYAILSPSRAINDSTNGRKEYLPANLEGAKK